MGSNFNKKLIPEKGKIYFISYIDKDFTNYVEFYCKIDKLVLDTVYFTITDYLKGNDDGKYKLDIQVAWTQSDLNATYMNEMTEFDLKQMSRCTQCAKRLNFIRTALCCKLHGVQGGI